MIFLHKKYSLITRFIALIEADVYFDYVSKV